MQNSQHTPKTNDTKQAQIKIDPSKGITVQDETPINKPMFSTMPMKSISSIKNSTETNNNRPIKLITTIKNAEENFPMGIPLEALSIDQANGYVFTIPDLAYQFKNIRKMDASHNHIKILPDGFFKQFPRLEDFDISFNRLKTIRNFDFESMGMLETLILSNNNIDHISKQISLLEKLKVLHIDRNSFEEQPKSIASLQNLKEIKLDWLSYTKPEYFETISKLFLRDALNSLGNKSQTKDLAEKDEDLYILRMNFEEFMDFLIRDKTKDGEKDSDFVSIQNFLTNFSAANLNTELYVTQKINSITNRSLLHRALSKGDQGIAFWLIKKYLHKLKDHPQYSPDYLLHSLKEHRNSITKFLLNNLSEFYKLEKIGQNGNDNPTQLEKVSVQHVAAQGMSKQLIIKILKVGMWEPNCIDNNGNTPQHHLFSIPHKFDQLVSHNLGSKNSKNNVGNLSSNINHINNSSLRIKNNLSYNGKSLFEMARDLRLLSSKNSMSDPRDKFKHNSQKLPRRIVKKNIEEYTKRFYKKLQTTYKLLILGGANPNFLNKHDCAPWSFLVLKNDQIGFKLIRSVKFSNPQAKQSKIDHMMKIGVKHMNLLHLSSTLGSIQFIIECFEYLGYSSIAMDDKLKIMLENFWEMAGLPSIKFQRKHTNKDLKKLFKNNVFDGKTIAKASGSSTHGIKSDRDHIHNKGINFSLKKTEILKMNKNKKCSVFHDYNSCTKKMVYSRANTGEDLPSLDLAFNSKDFDKSIAENKTINNTITNKATSNQIFNQTHDGVTSSNLNKDDSIAVSISKFNDDPNTHQKQDASKEISPRSDTNILVGNFYMNSNRNYKTNNGFSGVKSQTGNTLSEEYDDMQRNNIKKDGPKNALFQIQMYHKNLALNNLYSSNNNNSHNEKSMSSLTDILKNGNFYFSKHKKLNNHKRISKANKINLTNNSINDRSSGSKIENEDQSSIGQEILEKKKNPDFFISSKKSENQKYISEILEYMSKDSGYLIKNRTKLDFPVNDFTDQHSIEDSRITPNPNIINCITEGPGNKLTKLKSTHDRKIDQQKHIIKISENSTGRRKIFDNMPLQENQRTKSHEPSQINNNNKEGVLIYRPKPTMVPNRMGNLTSVSNKQTKNSKNNRLEGKDNDNKINLGDSNPITTKKNTDRSWWHSQLNTFKKKSEKKIKKTNKYKISKTNDILEYSPKFEKLENTDSNRCESDARSPHNLLESLTNNDRKSVKSENFVIEKNLLFKTTNKNKPYQQSYRNQHQAQYQQLVGNTNDSDWAGGAKYRHKIFSEKLYSRGTLQEKCNYQRTRRSSNGQSFANESIDHKDINFSNKISYNLIGEKLEIQNPNSLQFNLQNSTNFNIFSRGVKYSNHDDKISTSIPPTLYPKKLRMVKDQSQGEKHQPKYSTKLDEKVHNKVPFKAEKIVQKDPDDTPTSNQSDSKYFTSQRNFTKKKDSVLLLVEQVIQSQKSFYKKETSGFKKLVKNFSKLVHTNSHGYSKSCIYKNINGYLEGNKTGINFQSIQLNLEKIKCYLKKFFVLVKKLQRQFGLENTYKIQSTIVKVFDLDEFVEILAAFNKKFLLNLKYLTIESLEKKYTKWFLLILDDIIILANQVFSLQKVQQQKDLEKIHIEKGSQQIVTKKPNVIFF